MNKSQLFLTLDNFSSPTVLALAWKKAHQYIRTTNWYADNFELDKSSMSLAELCAQWATEIEQEKLVFSELELVPAPKSQQWEFKQQSDNKGNFCIEWVPKIQKVDDNTSNEFPVKLRPLAHIGIKEQTVMTLLMMFLANKVESQQGDPNSDYKEVHDKRVVSYGNRIYCTGVVTLFRT